MIAVGVRDLKNRLSEYLRLVRAGEIVLVTDRGEVVAEIRKPGQIAQSENPALWEMIERGAVRPGAPKLPGAYAKLEARFTPAEVSQMLDAERAVA